MGAQWSAVSVVGALGAAGVGALRDATGGYRIPVSVLVLLVLAAAALVLAAGRVESPRPGQIRDG